ncbi:MAG: hypothetical protein U1F41_13230 [Burkholderiales bacterium]
MKNMLAAIAIACAAGAPLALAQTSAPSQSPSPAGLQKELQKQSTTMPEMTAEQTARYKAEYQAAKAKWATLTPQEQQRIIAAAKQKKLSDLSMMELVGQRNDMQRETAAQSAQLKAQADAAKAKWDSMTPAQKKAVKQAAWQKKRADLDALESVGQRDDNDILPY